MNNCEAMTYITIEKEKVMLALEALTATMSTHGFREHIAEAQDKAIKALEDALAKQEQGEPVAIVDEVSHNGYLYREVVWKIRPHEFPIGTEIYTTPQQRTAAEGEDTRRAWVGLTGDEIYDFWPKDLTLFQFQDIAHAIEAKLKEKNT
jgi:hypothetical protein